MGCIKTRVHTPRQSSPISTRTTDPIIGTLFLLCFFPLFRDFLGRLEKTKLHMPWFIINLWILSNNDVHILSLFLRELCLCINSSNVGRLFKKIELSESIRYAPGDPIESWLHDLLCLDVSNSIPHINRLELCCLKHAGEEPTPLFHSCLLLCELGYLQPVNVISTMLIVIHFSPITKTVSYFCR